MIRRPRQGLKRDLPEHPCAAAVAQEAAAGRRKAVGRAFGRRAWAMLV
ncbi:MAG TPA: hypothetical protein VMN76_02075 [Acidobacteriota bacterium]|nr:hypothetical protein [Acidobacteriota bacterium]